MAVCGVDGFEPRGSAALVVVKYRDAPPNVSVAVDLVPEA